MTETPRRCALVLVAAALSIGAAEPGDAGRTATGAAADSGAPPPAAVSSGAKSPAAASSDASVDAILDGTAPPVDYSQAVKCLQSERLERTEPLSERYIVFHLLDHTLWIAQMRARCPGMTIGSKLVFEKNNPRICEWDTVRVVYEEGTHLRFGPRCNLPKFEPVSPEQVVMLKERIASARKGPLKSPQ